MSEHVTFNETVPSSLEAVELAKTEARERGRRVLTVVRVEYRPLGGKPRWAVTLAVR